MLFLLLVLFFRIINQKAKINTLSPQKIQLCPVIRDAQKRMTRGAVIGKMSFPFRFNNSSLKEFFNWLFNLSKFNLTMLSLSRSKLNWSEFNVGCIIFDGLDSSFVVIFSSLLFFYISNCLFF